MDTTNLQVIRESFGRVVYTHKTHEKAAEIENNKATIVKWINIVLTALTSTSVLSDLISNRDIFGYTSSILAMLTLAFVIFQLSFNPEENAEKHRQVAKELWFIRERYVCLLTDIKNQSIINLNSGYAGADYADREISYLDGYAQSFTVGSSDIIVDRASIVAKWTKDDAYPTSTVRVVLYSDSAGSPGSSLAASAYVTLSEFEDVYQTINFFFASAYTLTASTTYWLYIDWAVNSASVSKLALGEGADTHGVAKINVQAGGWAAVVCAAGCSV